MFFGKCTWYGKFHEIWRQLDVNLHIFWVTFQGMIPRSIKRQDSKVNNEQECTFKDGLPPDLFINISPGIKCVCIRWASNFICLFLPFHYDFGVNFHTSIGALTLRVLAHGMHQTLHLITHETATTVNFIIGFKKCVMLGCVSSCFRNISYDYCLVESDALGCFKTWSGDKDTNNYGFFSFPECRLSPDHETDCWIEYMDQQFLKITAKILPPSEPSRPPTISLSFRVRHWWLVEWKFGLGMLVRQPLA